MSAWVTPVSIYGRCGESTTHEAYRTIDDVLSTYWTHSVVHMHWVKYDLGEDMEVSGIRVYADGTLVYGHPCQISEIYVSTDPANWGSSVGSLTLDTTLQWHKTFFTTKTGRYIYLKLKTWDLTSCVTTSNLKHFYEFDAYVKPVFSQGYIFG